MGTYDTLVDGNKSGQVKCWDNSMNTFHPGDLVPELDGRSSYNIALREGGFAIIDRGIFMGIKPSPLKGEPLADKYGDWHTKEDLKEFYDSMRDPFSAASLQALIEEGESSHESRD